MDMSPFHVDELAAQSLAHQSSSGAGIRAAMPDQHRSFFELLPYLFVATADQNGWPVASVLHGNPGFVRSPDPTSLHIDKRPASDDPAAAGWQAGRSVGLLGIDLSNRRRNRANGKVAALGERGTTVAVAQSFGNCAQYIQTRRPTVRHRHPSPVQHLAGLDQAARSLIASADTFLVASRSRPTIEHASGLDVSHRGGRPGFVAVEGDTLLVPDFRGNRFFNTLGNLLGDPRAGLLFIDFANGDLLQLQGTATIDWTDRDAARLAGAQRTWRVKVERGWRQPQALPFDWIFGDYAPTTLATGVWTSE
ncbi:pyridoxamine 5'-phosphate oxidase family protein [Reyranella sp.]|uniref:pyridoxamine 5'-phosphate oxidase family protein n=1 Tax=Reyranella sp. TaxID=1929291 RepID=UPI002F95A5C5